MDFKDELEIVEYIENSWQNFPKNKIWETKQGGETCFSIACKAGSLRVLLSVIVGVRKGLREQVFALDDSQEIPINKLVLAHVNSWGGTYILPLVEMGRILEGTSGILYSYAVNTCKEN